MNFFNGDVYDSETYPRPTLLPSLESKDSPIPPSQHTLLNFKHHKPYHVNLLDDILVLNLLG